MPVLNILSIVAPKEITNQTWDATRAAMETRCAIEYINRYSGQWYKWAGDDPTGFDCSGLACEFLKALGVLARRSDFTAQQLYDKLPSHQTWEKAHVGDLVFFGNSTQNIIHVEIMVSMYLSIGASGGGSKTLTVKDAIRDRAFIKVRPICVGRGQRLVAFCDVSTCLRKVFETGQPLV